MKWNSRRVSAWAYAAPTDLRKGFDGLSALVLKELSRDPVPVPKLGPFEIDHKSAA